MLTYKIDAKEVYAGRLSGVLDVMKLAGRLAVVSYAVTLAGSVAEILDVCRIC